MDQNTSNINGINIGGTIINNLKFADDIDPLSEDHTSLQDQVLQLTKAAEEGGLMWLAPTGAKPMGHQDQDQD
ncbi:unnamed protein product, partial [Adineta ricciae]